jgi:hypothetical protein
MPPSKTLQTRIRLNQWQLDDQRRQLTALHEQEARLQTAETRLLEEVEEERQVMSDTMLLHVDFSFYRQHAKSRHESIKHQQGQLEITIVKAKDQVIDQFREVKTFEIADHNRQQLWQQSLSTKETQESDDRATMRCNRPDPLG